MKAANEVLGVSGPGGASWLFKSIRACTCLCSRADVATHVCERTCPSQKCERDALLERDFKQHKGQMRRQSSLVSFKASLWVGVLKMEDSTVLKGTV